MDWTLVGRDAEIAAIGAFLSAAPGALAITGDAGIGKTAVWQCILGSARGQYRVLSCRPAPAERPLAFSALDDLFGGVAEEVLPVLPGPRRRAVEAALLRDPSLGAPPAGGAGPEPRVLGRGILDVLRALSARTPILVAVDDAQWLDRPSARVLAFCFRRLQGEPVSILLTLRDDGGGFPLGLERALPPERLRGVRLGPLSLGAIGEILRSRQGTVLPRYSLTRLYDACGGNPFYALEYAQVLGERPSGPMISEPIPIPHSLGDLVRRRVGGLAADVRAVGRLIAAAAVARERLIRAACDDDESWAAIDRAVDVGLVEREGEVLRFTHPLLRAALYGEMQLTERRQVHRRLAAAAEDVEERAWHAALGADRPSEEIARMLDGAAGHAALRGAPEEAAALAGQATRLTPAGRPESARERVMHAADYYFRAGELVRSKELIETALPACPAGPVRAALLVRLATIYYHHSGWPLAERTFRQAAEEAAGAPALYAHAEQELAFARMVAGDLPGASRLARASLQAAEQAGDPRLAAYCLARLAVFEFLQGHGPRLDLLDQAEAMDVAVGAEPPVRLPSFDPVLVRGLILKWCDRLDEARPRLAGEYRYRTEHGDEACLPFLLYHLSELECWAGKWDAAEEYALEACRVADEGQQHGMRPATLYSLALVRAHQGHVQAARELADEGLALCDRTGNVPVRTMLLAVLGFVATSLEDFQAAHSYLGRVAGMASAAGLGEPGVVKFLPDEIEALTALGENALAWSLARQLEERGRLLGRAWALATAARCQARLSAADGDLDRALVAGEQALAEHERLAMPFELGRTLLVQGVIERQAGRQLAARTTLGRALDVFGRLGAPLWAAKAARELSAITVRPTPADGLTPTERRVAALVTRGRTNREVAATLFVTENTVQTHIRHIFQKLGVRSRTELAALLLAAPVARLRPEYH